MTGVRFTQKFSLYLFTFEQSYLFDLMKGGGGVKIDDYEKQLLAIINELIGYLIKTGANEQDAQDVAQETIVKILEIDIVLPPEKIRPWIFRVGINLYINLYNRQKRYQEILTIHFNPKLEQMAEVDYSQLYNGLSKLDLKSVNLLLMKYDQEMSLEEMAFILDRPKESLKTELYRARQKLKQILTREAGEDDNI